MAITTVNPRYEGFIFDGENSRDYGIYVQNVKVFGAPTRDVEMISIPGRDGEFALDKGRFNNIQVVYTCAFGTDTQTDFNTGVSDFRNWLASRKGYKRLEDEINTTEYRMAVFKDGLDVSTLNKETGTFEVTFDCKPQRFLKSGETAVTVTSGGTLVNPTLFEAKPLLQVWGYGDININNAKIQIINSIVGNVQLCAESYSTSEYATSAEFPREFNGDILETGNTITLESTVVGMENRSFRLYIKIPAVSGRKIQTRPVVTPTVTGFSGHTVTCSYGDPAGPAGTYSDWMEFYITGYSSLTFAKGTASSVSGTASWTMPYVENSTNKTTTVSISCEIEYDGESNITLSTSATSTNADFLNGASIRFYAGNISGYSTLSTLGAPLYFDLDIGEAYKIEGGQIISVNNAVNFPAELPVLVSGQNSITYDNTIDEFKITPRWWEV